MIALTLLSYKCRQCRAADKAPCARCEVYTRVANQLLCQRCIDEYNGT
jgi:hypothetical protein